MKILRLKNLRLNTRLILGFAVPVLILVALAVVVGSATSRMTSKAWRARTEGFAPAMAAQQLKYHTVQVQQWLTDISATRGLDGLDDGFTKAEEHAKSFEKILQGFQQAAAKKPKELQQLAAVSSAFDAYYRDAALMAKAYVAEGPQGGNGMMAKVDKAAEELVSAMDPFVEQRRQEGQEVLADLAADATRIRSMVWWSAAGAAALAVGTGLLLGRSIARPVQRVIGHFRVTAQGDLTSDVPPELRKRKDEIGEFACSVQSFVEMLRCMLGEVSDTVNTLTASSSQMSAVARQTATGVRSTSEKASMVASAAEEMSSNSSSVAAGMERATGNLASVAAATEQMTSTIGEIAARSESARAITSDATRHAEGVTARMKELSQAAEEIGKVTEAINAISCQTNLLALNATIEAARAGASGRGFAVVAHEIKELARQTAVATEDIESKVGCIQTATHTTARDFAGAMGVIQQVSEMVGAIATAIEEQSSVTKDIARNVTEAATGVGEANDRVAQINTVSQSVAKEIAAVDRVAGDVTSGTEQVLRSSAELSDLAEDLQRLVDRFKLNSENSASARARIRPAGPVPRPGTSLQVPANPASPGSELSDKVLELPASARSPKAEARRVSS